MLWNTKLLNQGSRYIVCRKCSGFTGSAEDEEEIIIDGNVIEKVVKFSYLENVLSSRGGVQEVVTARIRCRWKKFRVTASVQSKRVMSLKL